MTAERSTPSVPPFENREELPVAGARLRQENKLLYAELARLPSRQAAEAFGRVREGLAEFPIEECLAHDSGPILWPGTAHQGTICRRCGVFLPC